MWYQTFTFLIQAISSTICDFCSFVCNVRRCNNSKICLMTTVGSWICQLTLPPVLSCAVYIFVFIFLLFWTKWLKNCWGRYGFELHVYHLVSVIKGGQKITLLRLDTEPYRDKIAFRVTNILFAFFLFLEMSHFLWRD